MSEATFALDWLALRAGPDVAARAPALEAKLRAALPERPRLVDLGAGTAANLRHLAPRLGGTQRWILVDHDEAMLEAAREALALWAEALGGRWTAEGGGGTLACPGFTASVVLRAADLASELASCVQDADALLTSALLDLAGATWLDALADAIAARRCPVLATLSVDGRLALTPEDPDDAQVLTRFAAHQRREKGLGVSLGPDAVSYLARGLEARGYAVTLAESDWVLGAADAPLQEAMIVGLSRAADAIAPGEAGPWRARRLARLGSGVSTLRVGHLDLYAEAR